MLFKTKYMRTKVNHRIQDLKSTLCYLGNEYSIAQLTHLLRIVWVIYVIDSL